MKQVSKILVAPLLILVFSVFTVGIPVVKFLCPMMNDDNPVCCMSMNDKTDGSSVATPIPDCCTSYIIAERNTTPYYSADHGKTQDLSVLQFVYTPDYQVPVVYTTSNFLYGSSPPLLAKNEHLYILNSSILI
jgi:hypothetical protein